MHLKFNKKLKKSLTAKKIFIHNLTIIDVNFLS